MIAIPIIYLEEIANISKRLDKLEEKIQFVGITHMELQSNDDPDGPRLGRFIWKNDQWYFIPDVFFEDSE